MRKNWDLIRDILLKADELEPNYSFNENDLAKYDYRETARHLVMLANMGFIIHVDPHTIAYQTRICCGLTREGDEFLEMIRDPIIWERAKTILKDKGLEMTSHTLRAATAKAIALILK
ncbi:hypothetical protein CIG19_17830 [Enterobacterales bacterium CwR94]|nr:hypothetical protein CIG19_17830 [Enterobacterales bacterium CwR94]